MKKKHTIHINFINYFFFVTKNRKGDIIAIKVIGTALNKPNLPYIIFCKVDMDTCQLALILVLKIDNVFTSLIESGTSSHIFGARDTRLSLP